MSKIRNSLGVIVLPVPKSGPITWEQYKAQTGIDLHSLFEISEVSSYFKPSKLLAISGFGPSGGLNESIFDVELVKMASVNPILEDDEDIGNIVRLTAVTDDEGNPYCGIDLCHYSDGRDDPYLINIFIN